jgi:hypothetical protein
MQHPRRHYVRNPLLLIALHLALKVDIVGLLANVEIVNEIKKQLPVLWYVYSILSTLHIAISRDLSPGVFDETPASLRMRVKP